MANKGITLERAKEILGEKFVISKEFSDSVWGEKVQCQAEFVPYSEELLLGVSQQNTHRRNFWVLAWVNGLSLQEQLEGLGADRGSQPCFDQKNHLLPVEALSKREPGYLLFNLLPEDLRFDHAKAKEYFSARDDRVWAEVDVLSEVVLTYYIATRINLLEHQYHAGPKMTSEGYVLAVGMLSWNGLQVSLFRSDDARWDLRHIYYIKPIF